MLLHRLNIVQRTFDYTNMFNTHLKSATMGLCLIFICLYRCVYVKASVFECRLINEPSLGPGIMSQPNVPHGGCVIRSRHVSFIDF